MKRLAIVLLVAVLVFGAGCQVSEPSDASFSYKEVTAQELLSWIEEGKEFQLIDVREENEFNEGHIPDAQLLPLGELEDNYMLLDPDDVIVLVCRSARRSGEAAEFLSGQGYTEVYNLVGGMLEWPGPVK